MDPLYGRESQTLWTSLAAAGFEMHKYVFPGGEDCKNMETIEELLEFLAAKRFSRTDVLLALGGGIVGDVTGFAAATYLRGVEFIQVPTTLLAIVDSSVGGKTGVNLKAGKNLAGTFWQPSLVLFDPEVLGTLSYDITLDGIAEAIKAGVIADPLILDSIKMKRTLDDPDFLMNLASLAIEVKRKVVEEDERDNGSRQLLNFGHTLAHAIEKCSLQDQSRSCGGYGHEDRFHSFRPAGLDGGKVLGGYSGDPERFKFPLRCPFSAWGAGQRGDAGQEDPRRQHHPGRVNSSRQVLPEDHPRPASWSSLYRTGCRRRALGVAGAWSSSRSSGAAA